MDSTSQCSFRILQRFPSDYSTGLITKYESERTGLQVLVVDAKGPKVDGFFTLATEIHDDSGAPHTLEHLIFMGSKSYQYKGVLSKLSNRAYAYNNAWTAVDHTAYMLSTAGFEGFIQILPVYLEHVLMPTLTDSACYTEVHHVDGTGHDAGVVYSEMQSLQNTAAELLDLKARQLIYPESVGFRQETGGMMQELRRLSADRIRDFHRQMYQPKNLCLILFGEVDHDSLLRTLETFESNIIHHFPKSDAEWKRPWTDHARAPALQRSVVEVVEFPEEDESAGEILISFLGPDVRDQIQGTALSVMLSYLAESSVSVLQNALVEKEQLASEISHCIEERPDTLLQIKLSGVATDSLDAVERRFFEVLNETASKPLNMSYMKDCIEREKRQIKMSVENSPQVIHPNLISNFLFGERDGSDLPGCVSLKHYDEVASWGDDQWRRFLRRWISGAHHVSLLGTPSAAMSQKLKADEEARVEEQIAQLGPDGLRDLEKKLTDAKAQNEVDVPSELLAKFPIPSTESIHFIETTTARSGLARDMGVSKNHAQDIIDRDQSDLPLFIHFEDVETNFVYIKLLIATETVPVERRPLLPLYMENFFTTPVKRNGDLIPFEKVVMELEKDTVFHDMRTGERVRNSEVLVIDLRVEPEKYEAAARWVEELLLDSVFDEERIQATIARMLGSIPEEKRDGAVMMSAVDSVINYNNESIIRSRSTLVKAPFLKQIKKLLREDPQAILSGLEEIRRSLCHLEHLRLLVIADLKKLEKPVTAWQSFNGRLSGNCLGPLGSAAERLSQAGITPGRRAYLIPMSTIDTSYSLHTAKGFNSALHPKLPSLLVALAYLDADEGPFWHAIRGGGLAYGSQFERNVESGHLTFLVHRSPAASEAFTAGKKIVEDFISGATQFDPSGIEGAISDIVLGFADREYGMAAAGRASFVNQVILGVPKDYNAWLLKGVRLVTVDDVKAILKEVVLPVFDPEKTNVVITCATVEVERVKAGFEKEGFDIEVRSLSSFQEDYGLGVGMAEGEEDDEEVEDELDDMDELEAVDESEEADITGSPDGTATR